MKGPALKPGIRTEEACGWTRRCSVENQSPEDQREHEKPLDVEVFVAGFPPGSSTGVAGQGANMWPELCENL